MRDDPTETLEPTCTPHECEEMFQKADPFLALLLIFFVIWGIWELFGW